jgi:hypothetical protein
LEVMLIRLRWYAAYPLSLRHIGEMVGRGLFVDHATVHRWAIKTLPILVGCFAGASVRSPQVGGWTRSTSRSAEDGSICTGRSTAKAARSSFAGIAVARVTGTRAHVVFITAFGHFAVQAFEEGAVYYLLKPLDPSRLARALRRVKDRLTRPPADLSGLLEQLQRGPASERLRWIAVLHGRDVQLITIEDICYFRADRSTSGSSRPKANR